YGEATMTPSGRAAGSVCVRGEPARVVVSCFGEGSGGLYVLEDGTVAQLDPLESTGMCLFGRSMARVLWAPSSATSTGELLIYDSAGLRKYFRIDELQDPHDVAWDGSHWRVVSSIRNSVLRVSSDGDVVDEWRPTSVPDAWHLNGLTIVDGHV